MNIHSPREVDESVQYAITLTCGYRLLKKPSFDQLSALEWIFENNYHNHPFDSKTKLTLVAELTKNQDVHLHGFVSVDRNRIPKSYRFNYIRYFKDKLKNNPDIGFSVIKTVDNYPKWKEYISKDIKTTFLTMGRTPIIRDDFGMFHTDVYEFLNDDIIEAIGEDNKDFRLPE